MHQSATLRRACVPVLIVLCGALATACGGGGSNAASTTTALATTTSAATTTTAAPTTTTTAAPTTTTTAAAGCTEPCANADNFVVHVTNFRYDVASDNQFIQPETGNVYVTLDVTFHNHNGSTHRASPFDFTLTDGTGVSRDVEWLGPCETWSSAELSPGATLGPKCLAFQAAAGHQSGITLKWTPGFFGSTYTIPLP